jgi:hypothetical protein
MSLILLEEIELAHVVRFAFLLPRYLVSLAYWDDTSLRRGEKVVEVGDGLRVMSCSMKRDCSTYQCA